MNPEWPQWHLFVISWLSMPPNSLVSYKRFLLTYMLGMGSILTVSVLHIPTQSASQRHVIVLATIRDSNKYDSFPHVGNPGRYTRFIANYQARRGCLLLGSIFISSRTMWAKSWRAFNFSRESALELHSHVSEYHKASSQREIYYRYRRYANGFHINFIEQ